MRFEMLKSKIHRAKVTGADLDYEGSISICPRLLEASGLRPWERVDVFNVNNGERFSTYVIVGGDGEICLNGAAARLVQRNDLVIIVSYCTVGEDEVARHVPKVVLVDGDNRPVPAEAHPSGGARLGP
jgi:aspartate 1-decarboxylase